jgi:hypothetical protein
MRRGSSIVIVIIIIVMGRNFELPERVLSHVII